jgi:hypothetical protein
MKQVTNRSELKSAVDTPNTVIYNIVLCELDVANRPSETSHVYYPDDETLC